ncbi:hypothetical protein ABPG77_009742 [Micractinium sp. CCAP 211/92]
MCQLGAAQATTAQQLMRQLAAATDSMYGHAAFAGDAARGRERATLQGRAVQACTPAGPGHSGRDAAKPSSRLGAGALLHHIPPRPRPQAPQAAGGRCSTRAVPAATVTA